MKRKIVWVVECGEYSDYRVVGVFTSEKNARMIASAVNAGESNEAKVAKWKLDPAVAELRKDYHQFVITMRPDGTVENLIKQESPSFYDIIGKLWVWERTQASAYKGQDVTDAVHGTVWARNEKHAIKIANEKRLQYLASGELKQREEDRIIVLSPTKDTK
jgi:hypothetical protein